MQVLSFHAKLPEQLSWFSLITVLVLILAWLALVSYTWGPGLLRRGLLWTLRRVYRVRAEGLENLPVEGGALLVCNHVSYIDAVILSMVSPRPIRFLSFDGLMKVPVVGMLLRMAGVIPVSPQRSRRAIAKAAACLQRGEIVGIFPEGHLTRDGRLHAFKSGFQIIASRAGVPVLPVCLDGLWGSIFSFAGGRFFWKLPRKFPYPVRVTFGPLTDPDIMSPDTARQTILDLGSDAFDQQAELKEHLGWRVLKSLRRHANKEMVVDRSVGRRAFKGGVVLALSLLIAERLRKQCPGKRVGIVLPPGIGGVVVNLACVLSGKTPVNLNFTLGREALKSCLKRADIDTIVTAAPVKAKVDGKFPDFPWTDKLIDIKDEIGSLSKLSIIAKLLSVKLLPASTLASRNNVPKVGGREEAAILFTSGSDGMPKGVVLSHHNILANAMQVALCRAFPTDETLLGNLPIFHSFGFTVSIWCPMLYGVRTVYTPSPLDFKGAVTAIREEKCGILLGTPTFYRPYLTRVDPADMATAKVVIAGAEKTPKGFHEAWQERFPNCAFLEGYGLTETTPVVSVNEPDIVSANPDEAVIGTRAKSVGRLFPGMAARVRNPDTYELQSVGQTGIVEFKGANVFEGYLNDPEKTAEVLRGGWLTTGDLGRLDEDGFLYIEGRISRFSKIGGEMVPHGTVETVIAEVFGVHESELPLVAVSARQDPAKGEALVLVSAIDVDTNEMQQKLAEAGLANLWVPRIVKRVEAIPTLASGKLDLKGLKQIANQED